MTAALSRRGFVRSLGASVAAAAATGGRVEAHPSAAPDAGPAGGPIRLDQTRNPYGPSPGALQAARDGIAAAAGPGDADPGRLAEAIASVHHVDRDSIVLGCGSSDLLRAAARAFAGPDRPVVVAAPTCPLMAWSGSAAGAPIETVPLRADHAHDLDAMLTRAGRAGLVYLCNPNSPTGTLTQRRDVERLLDRLPEQAHVLVDEAYFHYVDPSPDYVSCADRAARDPRVIVTRTFSKVYGLPGLRAGYAVAAPSTAARLAAERLDSSLSVPAVSAALAALADDGYVRRSVERNADSRQEFQNQVNARMLKSIDSQASFILFESAHPARMVIEHFRVRGIVLADPPPDRPRQIRVALGTADEMAAFWRVWDLLPAGSMVM